MKRDKQLELLQKLSVQVYQSNAPEPKNLDDARFFVERGNILWIFHDKNALEEHTLCCYKLTIEEFIVVLTDFLENNDIGSVFNNMEEKCTAHISVTAGNPLHQKLEDIFNGKIGFIGDGRNKNTLHELIMAVYKELQYVDICEAGYDDAFFINKEAEYITWMYYNPDSNEGGQFVNSRISFAQILEAAEKENNPKDFFCYLGSISRQTLEDIGTIEFEAEKKHFFQEPDLKNLTKDTMESLITTAKGGEE